MNFKLKTINGKVDFLLRTGKDFVKNQMPIASAQRIIDKGKVKKSPVTGYLINVDDKWYFKGEIIKNPTSKNTEVIAE